MKFFWFLCLIADASIWFASAPAAAPYGVLTVTGIFVFIYSVRRLLKNFK